ncbi:MAG: DMT family transporter [Lentisphaerae bacterium]|nr:DMT family transporter [Lentisphaerota bacterium]MBT4815102.1 DMT family transporter [Lentisphaerota bacterium]MBT5611557.1 DMT family transporter [Lentisphaerota bacterium]MBT7059584.1 DMT family transporter [Lentisphaerota bacterium]MBT7844984.1 DMT family transporter [Lentisphaerota bacterium]
MRENHTDSRGIGFLLAAIFCFASVPVFLRHFTGFLDSWTVNGVRYALATCFWLPVVLRTQGKTEAGANVWRDALVPAAINIVMQIGWAMAPYHNTAVVIGFVIRCSFLFSTLFACLLLPVERGVLRHRLFWVGAAGIIGGLTLMYLGSLTAGGTTLLGISILVGTAALWGLYGVLVRQRMARYGAALSFGVVSLYTAVALGGLAFAVGDWRAAAEVSCRDWGLLVVSALFGIAFSHVLLYRAIHILGPVATEGGLAVLPFATALAAVLFLHEKLAALQWLGGVLLVVSCACLISTRYRKSPARNNAATS